MKKVQGLQRSKNDADDLYGVYCLTVPLNRIVLHYALFVEIDMLFPRYVDLSCSFLFSDLEFKQLDIKWYFDSEVGKLLKYSHNLQIWLRIRLNESRC